MSSEASATPKGDSGRKPVTFWDIVFWAGLGLLGVYTLRDLTDGRRPPELKHRPIRYGNKDWTVSEGQDGASRPVVKERK